MKTPFLLPAAALLLLSLHVQAQAPANAPAAPAASAAKPATAAGAVTTDSGLVYREMLAGKGASPLATDRVQVHYRGTFTDGREFDSSYSRGKPASFPLGGVIKCWTEGVQRMKVGGKSRLTCPPAIAYGDRGTPGGPIGPNMTLTFDIELLAINP